MSKDRVRWRKRRLIDLLDNEESALPLEEKPLLWELLEECHEAFNLEEGQRGETDLVQIHVSTCSEYLQKKWNSSVVAYWNPDRPTAPALTRGM